MATIEEVSGKIAGGLQLGRHAIAMLIALGHGDMIDEIERAAISDAVTFPDAEGTDFDEAAAGEAARMFVLQIVTLARAFPPLCD